MKNSISSTLFCAGLLRIIAIALCLAGAAAAQVTPIPKGTSQTNAPACQARAMRTIQEARLKAASGNAVLAATLADQADRECGTSYAVLRGICEIYGRLGRQELAAIYCGNSRTYISQKPPRNNEARQSFVREKFALIVGLGKFQSDRIPPLKYSAKDAADFAAVLTDPEVGRFRRENVTVLTDQQATSKAIRSALAAIAAKALEDDLVVLYFSTHGSNPATERSKVGSGYVVTYDTDAKDLYATAYGMDELARFMKEKIRAERIVTFLDTCYSGDTAIKLGKESKDSKDSKILEVEGAIPPASLDRISQGTGAVVIASSNNNELSWESDEKQNSFFTLYLIDSIRQRKGLGDVSQLYTDIQRQIPIAVQEYTRKKGSGEGVTQNPVIYPKSDIPNIVIGTPIQ
jgi:uncharacterized caspase-like protein